jgi:hypothetical protein
MAINLESSLGNRGNRLPPVSLWGQLSCVAPPEGHKGFMPRIPTDMMDTVFYLYPSVEAARAGHAAGGTGVFIGYSLSEVPGKDIVYACSNKHVVGKLGCSVLRLNRKDGTPYVLDSDPAEWTFDPHNDLAAITFPSHPTYRLKTVPLHHFITRDDVERSVSGPGDEIFMVGRFVNHDGLLINVPSVRFGHLSMMPLGIKHPDGYLQESFAVEMLSRPGYSGSPVWTFRTPYQFGSSGVPDGDSEAKFLGLNWGFITEPAEVKEEVIAASSSASTEQRTVRYISANTGMNGVVPAWQLRRLLDKRLAANRRQHIAAYLAKESALSPSWSASGAEPIVPAATDANPTHREDFTRLLGAAVKAPQSKD